MTCRCKYEFCYKCGGKYRECECVKSKQLIIKKIYLNFKKCKNLLKEGQNNENKPKRINEGKSRKNKSEFDR